jgi:anti-sigma factor RsiW
MPENESIERLHEELTSYLDGELDAQGVRAVEERLARDADYRAELQRLQRTWDLLDRLPRSSVHEAFSRTTIEMVAVAAAEEAAQAQSARPRIERRRRTFGAVAALAAAVVGFFIGRAMWPNPNEELLEDLNVLQNLELYYQADDIDFLRQLDRDGLFADEDAENAS